MTWLYTNNIFIIILLDLHRTAIGYWKAAILHKLYFTDWVWHLAHIQAHELVQAISAMWLTGLFFPLFYFIEKIRRSAEPMHFVIFCTPPWHRWWMVPENREKSRKKNLNKNLQALLEPQLLQHILETWIFSWTKRFFHLKSLRLNHLNPLLPRYEPRSCFVFYFRVSSSLLLHAFLEDLTLYTCK